MEEEKLLLADRLDAHTWEGNITAMKDKENTRMEFGPAGETQNWQPVDAEVGATLKVREFLANLPR